VLNILPHGGPCRDRLRPEFRFDSLDRRIGFWADDKRLAVCRRQLSVVRTVRYYQIRFILPDLEAVDLIPHDNAGEAVKLWLSGFRSGCARTADWMACV